MKLTLRIPGVPIAQPRVKATNRGKHAGVYTPTTIEAADGSRKSNGVAEFKSLIKMVASQHYTDPPLGKVPVIVDEVFVFPRHQQRPKWLDPAAWKSGDRYPHLGRSDRDNLDKMVLDALTGVLFVNDNVVYDGRPTKWHAAGDEQPHTRITITTEHEGSE